MHLLALYCELNEDIEPDRDRKSDKITFWVLKKKTLKSINFKRPSSRRVNTIIR